MGKSVAQLHEEAAAGSGQSMLSLAICYYEGNGLKKDIAKALEWAQKSVWRNVPKAGTIVGFILKDSDPDEAFLYFLHAAKAGDAQAQGFVGLFYDGRETAYENLSFPPHNPYTANLWFEKAINNGDVYSCQGYFLNLCYARGCAQDLYKAETIGKLGAKRGDAHCMYLLGLLYGGEWGIFHDPNQAGQWLNEAAKRGHSDAASLLNKKYTYSRWSEKWIARA